MKIIFLFSWISSLLCLVDARPVKRGDIRKNAIGSNEFAALAQAKERALQKNVNSLALNVAQAKLTPQAKVNEKGKTRDWLENFAASFQDGQESTGTDLHFNNEQIGTKHQVMDFYNHGSQLHSMHSPVTHHQHTAHIYDPNFSAHLDFGNDEGGFGSHATQDQGTKHPEAYPGEMIEDENTLSKYIAPPVFENSNQKNQISRHPKLSHNPEEMLTEKTNTKSLIDSLNSMMTPLQDQVEHPEEYGNEGNIRKDENKGYQKRFNSHQQGGFEKYETDADKGVYKSSIEENGSYQVKSFDDQEENHGTGREHEYHHTHSEDVDTNTFHDQSDDHNQGYSNSHYDSMASHKDHDRPYDHDRFYDHDHVDSHYDDRDSPHMRFNDEGADVTSQHSNLESRGRDNDDNSVSEMEHVKQFMHNREDQNSEMDSRIEGTRHRVDQDQRDSDDRIESEESQMSREDNVNPEGGSQIDSQESHSQVRDQQEMESREPSDVHADTRMERTERPQDDENSDREDSANQPDSQDHDSEDGEEKPIEVVQDEHEHRIKDSDRES